MHLAPAASARCNGPVSQQIKPSKFVKKAPKSRIFLVVKFFISSRNGICMSGLNISVQLMSVIYFNLSDKTIHLENGGKD